MGKFIVKVQASLFASDGSSTILVYNKDRSVMQEFPANKALIDDIGGEMKAFYYAHKTKDGYLALDEKAPWQKW